MKKLFLSALLIATIQGEISLAVAPRNASCQRALKSDEHLQDYEPIIAELVQLRLRFPGVEPSSGYSLWKSLIVDVLLKEKQIELEKNYGKEIMVKLFTEVQRRTNEIIRMSLDKSSRLSEATTKESEKKARVKVIAPTFLWELDQHLSTITSLNYSPDGQKVVTASNDNDVKIWTAATGELLFTIKAHKNWVNKAIFSRDGQFIYSGGSDKYIMASSAIDGTPAFKMKKNRDWVGGLDQSKDGRMLLVATGLVVRVKNAKNRRLLFELPPTDVVYSAEFSPDSRFILLAYADSTARIWDISKGKSVHVLRKHTKSITSAKYSPDGKKIVTAGLDQSVRVWDAETGDVLFELPGPFTKHTFAFFSPNGKMIVTGGGTNLRLWDAEYGHLLHTFPTDEEGVSEAAISPDSNFIIIGNSNGLSQTWKIYNDIDLESQEANAP